MVLENLCVLHKTFGNGTVTAVNGKYMTVAEEGGTGSIDTPLVNDELCKDDTYKKYTKGNVIWRPKSH